MFGEILERLSQRFGPDAIAAYLGTVLPGLLSAIIVMVVFILIWLGATRLSKLVLQRMEVDRTLVSFIDTALRYIILTVGIISALSEMGIDTKALLTSLGVAGLTLGFAAKDTLSNLISGIFIFWDRPFVLGDLVEFGGYYGRVDQITMRSTRLVTVDGKMVAIPNANIVNSPVVSYTNFPHLRIDVEVTVGVEEDLGRLRVLFEQAIADDERFMATPAPQMVVKTLNDYNVEVAFRVWLENEKEHIPARFELREELFELFRTSGVDMPYETLVVKNEPVAPANPPSAENAA
jgi:small conductance mechanosensitive channel